MNIQSYLQQISISMARGFGGLSYSGLGVRYVGVDRFAYTTIAVFPHVLLSLLPEQDAGFTSTRRFFLFLAENTTSQRVFLVTWNGHLEWSIRKTDKWHHMAVDCQVSYLRKTNGIFCCMLSYSQKCIVRVNFNTAVRPFLRG